MQTPNIVSSREWTAARKRLLAKEKELTRQRDALSAELRKLPMEAVEKDYAFQGPNGRRTLADLFEGKRQLIVYHFMDLFDHSDQAEGVAAFLAKRNPDWKND